VSGYAEPRLEPFAARYTGEPLEELSGLAASQDYHSDGPWLSTAAQDLLLMLGKGGRLGRFGFGSAQDGLAELVAAGLATGKGRLQGQGRLVTSPLENTLGTLQLTAGLGGVRTAFYCALGPEGVLVLAGPSCTRLRSRDGAETTHRQLDFLSLDQLYPALAAWLGIGPSWTLDEEAAPDPAAIQARMSGSGPEQVPAPEGSGPVVRHMWEQEWFIWQPAGGSTGLPTGIQAGTAGTWQLVRTEAGLVLRPWPSGAAYRSLLRAVSGQLS